MNWLDIAFLAILVLSGIAGLVRGLAREVLGLAGLVGGFLLALLFAPNLAPKLERWVTHPLAYPAAFLVLVLATMLAAEIAGGLLTRLVEAVRLSCLNRLAGGLFGLARGALLVVLAYLGLLFLVKEPTSLTRGSRLAPLACRGAMALSRLLPAAEQERWTDPGATKEETGAASRPPRSPDKSQN